MPEGVTHSPVGTTIPLGMAWLLRKVTLINMLLICSPVGITISPGTAVTEKSDVHDSMQMLRLKATHTFKIECWCFYRVQVAHKCVTDNRKTETVKQQVPGKGGGLGLKQSTNHLHTDTDKHSPTSDLSVAITILCSESEQQTIPFQPPLCPHQASLSSRMAICDHILPTSDFLVMSKHGNISSKPLSFKQVQLHHKLPISDLLVMSKHGNISPKPLSFKQVQFHHNLLFH